jgi:membrane protein YdbS with pleckstrin-like domain
MSKNVDGLRKERMPSKDMERKRDLTKAIPGMAVALACILVILVLVVLFYIMHNISAVGFVVLVVICVVSVLITARLHMV